MAALRVSSSFLITRGTGAGPQTWVVVSATREDGTSFQFPLTIEKMPVKVFIALSPTFAASAIQLKIVEVKPQEPGFCGLRVDPKPSDVLSIDQMKPSALGIVVDDGTDRGQALACSCHPAEVAK
jgi:hypothetical protein